jgi:hypothetical protein
MLNLDTELFDVDDIIVYSEKKKRNKEVFMGPSVRDSGD